jgi:putative transposase
MLAPKFPQVAELLGTTPKTSWPTCSSRENTAAGSTRPTALERCSREIKRRTRVVGIFPDRDSLIRMVGTLLAEQDDEWQVAKPALHQPRFDAEGADAREGDEDTKQLPAQIG